MRGTIVALGGGFSMSDDGSSPIDDVLLDLTGASRPRVCFIPTASGDAESYSRRFEDAFAGRAETSVLSLFCHDPWGYADPRILLDQDLVYVGGGSTANLLAVWRLHGLPEILAEAAGNGVVLAGISAGMNCWFESSSTDSFGPLAPLRDGLGFLSGSACPHYLGEPERRDLYQRWVAAGELEGGYAVDEYAAIVMHDGQFVEAICEQPDRPVFRVHRDGERAVEERIDVRRLPGRAS
ncbi:peptidase E [Microbacterium sp. MPKO10]|uniref:Type 1 glutamine amidotransferase-like domain-containing protein n=1 Tax=Microbacterium sp. MPKO10 TaxID=2989818 RepID=UPI002235B4D0|nr:peptidase E [Microbacterium sp. MPKO10]MCW4457085.1 peptidase E [Microbacterium sp. MPKO10]